MELGLNLAVDGNSSRRAGVGFPVSLPLKEQGKHTLSSHRERVFLKYSSTTEREGKLFRKEVQKRQITGGEERAIHAICISALAYKQA